MAEPPRKSRRLASKRPAPHNISSPSNHTQTIQAVVEDPGVQFHNQVQQQIRAAIPDITNSVIAALKAQGVIPMPQLVQQSETPPIPSTSVEVSPQQTPVTSASSDLSTETVVTCSTAGSTQNSNMNDSLTQFLNTGNNNAQLDQQSVELETTASCINFSSPSISKPLALGVDPKIKAKIWANEYIDLGSLLNKKFPKVRFQVIESQQGGISWEKQPPPKYRFESVAHWLSAFHIFVSIYCEKYPDQACALMKYANTIQTLARRSGDIAAFNYDRTFREWREHDWKKLPWDQVNNELYTESVSLGITAKFNSLKGTGQSQNKSSLSRGPPFLSAGVPLRNSRRGLYCYSYNNNGECERGPDCRYPHVCEKCGGMHSKKECKTQSHKRKRSDAGSNLDQKRPSGSKSTPTK
ncbi:uncharacterized protein LOC134264174 [Saccostrea cucullata]|uniref:uncharacterized protein LOC134264174 n=1 Tax=Saccostrea cuccullata TaxID=36930 RepID=UPI002ED1D02A